MGVRQGAGVGGRQSAAVGVRQSASVGVRQGAAVGVRQGAAVGVRQSASVGVHAPCARRCIRQTLWKLNKELKWREKHNIIYGDHSETEGSYTELLARSKFCLVIPGAPRPHARAACVCRPSQRRRVRGGLAPSTCWAAPALALAALVRRGVPRTACRALPRCIALLTTLRALLRWPRMVPNFPPCCMTRAVARSVDASRTHTPRAAALVLTALRALRVHVVVAVVVGAGDGWSARYEDSMTHGCVPVIIMDNTLGPFESLIDYTKFAIRRAQP